MCIDNSDGYRDINTFLSQVVTNPLLQDCSDGFFCLPRGISNETKEGNLYYDIRTSIKEVMTSNISSKKIAIGINNNYLTIASLSTKKIISEVAPISFNKKNNESYAIV